jgi:CheY-like chemotaxis protein
MTLGRVLVVEDEYLVRLMLADLLGELGYEVIALAANVQEAQQHAEKAQIDLALLDVNLGGEKVFPVADVLTRRGLPFCFVTGYGTAGISAAHNSRPVLQKPFQKDDLARTLRDLVRERSPHRDRRPNASA